MKTRRLFAIAGLTAAGAAGMVGCSADALIWGYDGAQVIRTTEKLIQDLGSGERSDVICEDADVDLGAAGDWEGRSAGEPEQFTSDFWAE